MIAVGLIIFIDQINKVNKRLFCCLTDQTSCSKIVDMLPVFISQNMSPFMCCKETINRTKEINLYEKISSKPQKYVQMTDNNRYLKKIIKDNEQFKETMSKYKVIGASHYLHYLERCQRLHEMFLDEEFPPNVISLGNLSQNTQNINNFSQNKIVWRRISDMIENPIIYHQDKLQNLTAEELQKCNISDRYILPTLSSLVDKNPQAIAQIFDRDSEFSPFGIYRVLVNYDGYPKEVLIDDYVPVYENTHKFVFTRPLKNQIWMCLVEKAWAKVRGSYERIQNGNPTQILKAFSMCPVLEYDNQQEDYEQFSNQTKIWELLKENCQRYPMCCLSQELEESPLKIKNDYTYVIERVFEDQTSPQETQFLVLRGYAVKQNKVSVSSKTRLLSSQIVPYSLFRKNFKSFSVCYYSQTCNLDFQESEVDNRKPRFYTLDIGKQGEVFLNFCRVPRKFSRNGAFRISSIQRAVRDFIEIKGGWIKLVVARKQSSPENASSEEYIYIDSAIETNLEYLTMRLNLQKGKYLIYAQGYSEESNSEQYVLSAYSQSQMELVEEISCKPFKYFLEEVMLNHSLNRKKQNRNYLGDEQTWYSSEFLYEKGGFGYVLAFLSSESDKKLKIKYNSEMIHEEGFKVECKRTKKYERVIKPGEADIVVFSIDYPAKKYMNQISFPPKGIKIQVVQE